MLSLLSYFHQASKTCLLYQCKRYYTQSTPDDDFVNLDNIAAKCNDSSLRENNVLLDNKCHDVLGVIRTPELPTNVRYSRLRLPLTNEVCTSKKFVRPNSRSCQEIRNDVNSTNINSALENVFEDLSYVEKGKVTKTKYDDLQQCGDANVKGESNDEFNVHVNAMQSILNKINCNTWNPMSDENANINESTDSSIKPATYKHSHLLEKEQHTSENNKVSNSNSYNMMMESQHWNDYEEQEQEQEYNMEPHEEEEYEESKLNVSNGNSIGSKNLQLHETQQLKDKKELEEYVEQDVLHSCAHSKYNNMKDSTLPYDDEKFAETILQMEVQGAIDEAWQDARKAELTDVKELTEVLKQMKVRDICCIDVSAKTASFDYILFGTCEGARHIHLSAWAVQEADSFHRVSKIKRQQSDETWEVVPVGRILVNLMLEDTRSTLMLERKWAITSFMDPLTAANAPISEGRNVKSHGLWSLTLNLQDLKDFEVDYCKDVLLRQVESTLVHLRTVTKKKINVKLLQTFL